MVRLEFADVLRLAPLPSPIHRYAGEKNTWVSHMSKAAPASLIHPASILHYLSVCSDLIQVRKVMIWDTVASQAASINSVFALL